MNGDPTSWLGFLEKAVWGLEEAARRLMQPDVRAEFERAPDWWRLPSKVCGSEDVRVPEETAVSGALADLFALIYTEQIVSGRPPGSEDLRHFSFDLEKRRAKDPAIGRNTKPTDIAIVLRSDMFFDLRIEAKTLLDGASIRSSYLSAAGLRRFEDSENPYTIEPFGGMLAYVVSDAPSKWKTNVRTQLIESLGAERVAETRVGERSFTTSRHSFTIIRNEQSETFNVDVLHFVVEIETDPSSRSRAGPLSPPPHDVSSGAGS